MDVLITASLALNIAVLLPVCFGLIKGANWTGNAFGQATPARGILLSVYLSICAVSCFLLCRPVTEAVAALLGVQILYKVTTPFTVGSFKNPVVVSNLLIAAVHAVTIMSIYRHFA